MSYLKNKSAAAYLLALAAVLILIGVIFYQSAAVTVVWVTILAIVTAVLSCAAAVLSGNKIKAMNLCPTVLAILSACTLAQSSSSQLDPLGWWISGLYTFEQVRGYIIFAVLLVIALLLQIIASFMNLNKE